MISNASANPVLSTIGNKFLLDASGFAGLAHLPLARVGLQSAAYYVADIENVLNIPTDIRRAIGSVYTRTQTKLSDDTFHCDLYGHEEAVPKEAVLRYASVGACKRAILNRVVHVIRMNHELRAHALITGADVPKAAVVAKWDQPGSNPAEDVRASGQAIRNACGRRPNTMSVGGWVYDALKSNDEVKKLIRINNADSRWPVLLARYFDVEHFVVADAVINTANEGAALSIADVWGDSVVLSFVDHSEDLEAVSFGRTFAWTFERNPNAQEDDETDADMSDAGIEAESYMTKDRTSLVVRAEQRTDEKLCAPTAAFHLEDCLA